MYTHTNINIILHVQFMHNYLLKIYIHTLNILSKHDCRRKIMKYVK